MPALTKVSIIAGTDAKLGQQPFGNAGYRLTFDRIVVVTYLLVHIFLLSEEETLRMRS